ncbi:hypothetical protein JMJ77_0005484 [Colletotrichum scovillei]|uniref:Uncharacterized protein n=1 Tax=Colletotrichum scovillei TaxID=1209932 RepID=A0A9P7UM44_9PEZI|nr:hypothetical protein JMJ77_0005484 [Colletotrichum scovillei]KAG7076707.1 hypothetical protein JMJ76_0013967 [Colletotrichum scovillei]KAG7083758.1 hypothetical protein JMJ78_0009200 [Colletotrichum scovillei]
MVGDGWIGAKTLVHTHTRTHHPASIPELAASLAPFFLLEHGITCWCAIQVGSRHL